MHGHGVTHDHDKHAGHDPAMFKKKFWLSLLLTIPVVLYSQTIQGLLGFTMPPFRGSDMLSVLFGTVIFFYGGLVFLKSAKSELVDRKPGMMTLISLAITVAFGYSLAVSLGLDGMDFWWELATLITIMLLGHWLEMASIMSAQGALKELAKLLPDQAELITKNGTKTIAVADLRIGDHVLVRPGANIPADGVITKGESNVNEAMLTGESKEVHKILKSEVIGGTINGTGALTVRVARIGEDTMLAGIVKLVSEAQNSKSQTQVIADKAAFYLTFVAVGAALLTAVGWVLFSDQSASFILERVVTVLVIACPHALGLAVPLVTAISTSLAAKNGLLVRERLALEAARNIDVVMFDKTGTLTKGEQGVVDIIATSTSNPNSVLRLAAAVERESEHPIAQAIMRAAEAGKISLPKTQQFMSLPGKGAQARVGSDLAYVGSVLHEKKGRIQIPADIGNKVEEAASEGKTVVYVITKQRAIGVIMLADVIRPESRQAVLALKKTGKRVAMLTGDNAGVAAWVANQLGIDEYFAEVLPEHKADVVKKLQEDGSVVAMVGDGVNDAPALTQADVGIAIGAGTDVAIESAGIVLVSSDPRGVAKVITLSKATYRKMVQNLFWGAGYNVIAIPLATGVTAGLGFVLSPALGAVFMSLSTIIVAANAQLLRRVKL